MSQYRITTELFTLPYRNGQVALYAPLVGFAAFVNQEVLNLLADLDQICESELSTKYRKVLQLFIEKRIINGKIVSIGHKKHSKKLSPAMLTLFPTNQCNLACRYCYAAENRKPMQTMRFSTGVSAVEYFIKLLREEEKDFFNLQFHGGGEPLFAWNFIQQIVQYVEKRCREEEFELQVSSASNGVLNRLQQNWLLEHFSSLLISFDVLPHVQDYHRPITSGTGSFPYVHKTLKFFDDHNFPYGIRCTVSNYNEDLLTETVDFVQQHYKTNLLILEPMAVCGKCGGDLENLKPDFQKFIDNYKMLEPQATSLGLRLEYSGAKFEKISSTFCSVGTDNFAVTPEGYLTNCWEVTSKAHSLANTFIFGNMLSTGDIQVNEEKISFLRSLAVENIDYCQDCFAKYHCAGDCVTRLGHQQFYGSRNSERCNTNRQIIAHRIIQMLERENFYQSLGQVGEKV